MLNLSARLGLDTSGFIRGLSSAVDGAKKASGTVGKEVGKDFTKALKRSIGAGAIAGYVISAMKEAQEIRNGAQALGVTNQQFAAMEIVAARLGDTTNVTTDEFMRLTQAVIDAGQVSSDNVFDKLAKSADDADAAIRRVKATGNSWIANSIRFVEAIGAGIGGGFINEQGSGRGFIDDMKQSAKQMSREFDRVWSGEPGSPSEDLFSNVKREPMETAPSTGLQDHLESWMSLVEHDNPKRKTQRGGSLLFQQDEFAKIGLGGGRGGFDLQKQLLEEAKKTNSLLQSKL